jgi:hypothetical protein
MSAVQSCRVISGLQAVQHQLPVLRSANDSGLEAVRAGQGDLPSAPGCDIGGRGEVRISSGAGFKARKKRITYWPGRCFGVRKPQQDEIPLCWAEIMIAVRDGILVPIHGGD